MLENVVDVEETMIDASLRDLPHVAWFFDFKAALSSPLSKLPRKRTFGEL